MSAERHVCPITTTRAPSAGVRGDLHGPGLRPPGSRSHHSRIAGSRACSGAPGATPTHIMPPLLVGYGTLLHRGSLGHSIGAQAAGTKEIVPVRVPGYRRLFNLRPTHYEPSAKLDASGIEAAAMNLEPADEAEFNGLAFPVDEEELSRLDERERYYTRRSVPLLHFDTGEELGTGFAYVSAPDAPWIERDVRRLMPLWRDIVWARDGAYRISVAFGEAFDSSTFLADGRTLVVDAYREVLDDTDDVAMPG